MELKDLASACRTPLEALNIPFEINAGATPTAALTASPGVAARCVVLADGIGRVQILTSRTRFLDLRALQNVSGRELRAIRSDDRAALCNQLDLTEVPGIPQVIGSPMWIDEALLEAGQVFLPAGQDQQWIRLERSAFARLVSDCRVLACSRELQQPTDDTHDRANIEKAVEQFTTLRIRERLDDTLSVPPLPDAARRIIQLQLQPDFEMSDLTRIVEGDAALAAQVVGFANSPLHRARGTITSVDDAITRVLGFDMVLSLALGLAVGQSLRIPPGFEGGVFRYWMQSVYAAATAEALARCMPRKSRVPPGIAYLCGLLHNFGFLVLAHVFPPHFQIVMAHRAANDHLTANVVEQELLGISGEQMAGALLEQWGLPEAVHRAVRFQSESQNAEAQRFPAQLLALTRQVLAGNGALTNEPHDALLEAELYMDLELDRDSANEAIEVLMDSSDELADMAKRMTA